MTTAASLQRATGWLYGLYRFRVQRCGGVRNRKAIVELIHFDGRGTPLCRAVTVSINGVIAGCLPHQVFAIDLFGRSDCTGLQFTRLRFHGAHHLTCLWLSKALKFK